MVSFLAPSFIAVAIGAAALVVFLHFYQRRRAQREILFSNTRLLKSLFLERLPHRKTKDILLAALRALCLFFLFVFLARPLYRGTLGGSSSPDSGRRVFWFVFDTSYSMDFRDAAGAAMTRRSEQAAKGLAQAIRFSFPDALIGAVSFAGRLDQEGALAPANDHRAVLEFASRLNAGLQETRQASWANWISSRDDFNATAGVFVLTDLARHGFTTPVDPAAKRWKGVPVVFVNLAAGDLSNRRLIVNQHEAGAPAEVSIRCYGLAGTAGDISLVVEDGLAGSVLATGRVKDCQKTEFPLKQFFGPGFDRRALRFVLPKDRLPLDDAEALVVRPAAQENLLVIDGEPGRRAGESESFYLRETLRALRYQGRWSWATEDEARHILADSRAADSIRQIWLLHPHKIEAATESFLRDFLDKKNRKLVVTLGPNADKEGIEKLLGISLTGILDGGEGKLIIPTRSPDTASSQHPASSIQHPERWLGNVSMANMREFDLSKVRVDKYFRVRSNGSAARSLLDWQGAQGNSTALLLELASYKAKVFLWTTTADMEWTNLPHKGFYISLVQGLLEESSGPSHALNVPAGQAWELLDSNAWAQAPSAVAPSGRIVRGRIENDRVLLGPLSELGFYKISWPNPSLAPGADEPARVIATHLARESAESDLTPAAARDIKALLGFDASWSVVPFSDILTDPRKSVALLKSREFSRPFLVLAFLCLFLESAVGLWKTRK
ncbi:MAG: BatA domain-containing protein [Elusimicrobia bacterium]|nr:BatA domain-containing protein [Elusimicrobiota bacterium]